MPKNRPKISYIFLEDFYIKLLKIFRKFDIIDSEEEYSQGNPLKNLQIGGKIL